MIFWFGVILPICYAPGITGATIPTQWGVLAVAGAAGLWRKGSRPAVPLASEHWLGIWFILFSALSLTWAVNLYDSVWGFAVVLIWAGSFWLGSTLESLEGMWKGLAIGLSVSSAVAIGQLAGFHPVLEAPVLGAYPGLLYSPLVSGAVSALVIVGLVCNRAWRYIPGVLPLLVLSHSRGGWLVLAVGLAGRYLSWYVAAAIVLLSASLMFFHPSHSDHDRMQIWQAAFANLRWFGLGPGTFTDLWMMVDWGGGNKVMERPEFAHNDYIQFIFEAGLGSVLVFALMAKILAQPKACLAQSKAREWPVFAGFAALGLFFFPLHTPLSAFIGCAVAGYIADGRYRVSEFERECRSVIVQGNEASRSAIDPHRGEAVSVQS